jgi:hypothetical protein
MTRAIYTQDLSLCLGKVSLRALRSERCRSALKKRRTQLEKMPGICRTDYLNTDHPSVRAT